MILYSRVKLIFARIALHLVSFWKWGFLKIEYSPFLRRPSCTLFPLRKTFCITIVFDFSLDDCYTEEKLERIVPLQSMGKCSMPFQNIYYEKPCLIFIYIYFPFSVLTTDICNIRVQPLLIYSSLKTHACKSGLEQNLASLYYLSHFSFSSFKTTLLQTGVHL